MAILLFLPALYGIIHLTLGSSMLSSVGETFRWRFSAILTATVSPLFYILALLFRHWGMVTKHQDLSSVNMIVLIMWCLTLCYVGARSYIVLEAFISIRTMPIGVL
jgi:hypothetical protein